MGLKSVEAGPIEAMDAIVLYVLRNLRKVEPGTVQAFRIDPERGALATVQPSRELRDTDTGKTEARKPITNVPILYPGIGDYVLAGKLAKGQKVLILVADAAIAGWLDGDLTSPPPAIDAPHSMAGALALPVQAQGVTAAAQLAQNLPADGVRLGSGSTYVDLSAASLTAEAIQVKLGATAAESTYKATTANATITAALSTLAAVPPPVDLATAITAIVANTAAITAIGNALIAAATTKTKVE